MQSLKSFNFINLYKLINNRRKSQIFGLMTIATITSFFEVLSISSVIPFITILIEPNKILDNGLINFFFGNVAIEDLNRFKFIITLIFISLTFLAAVFRIILLWVQTRLGYAIGSDISILLYSKALYQKYEFHISNNSSNIISSVIERSNAISKNVIMPILVILGSLLMTVTIISTLIYISPKITLIVIVFICSLYLMILIFTKTKLKLLSISTNLLISQRLKLLQEGLGGIRDIILNNSYSIFIKLFSESEINLRMNQANHQIISWSPRFLIECLAIILIALCSFGFVLLGHNLNNLIPKIAAFTLGAQKLLPIIQNLYSSWQNIRQSNNMVIESLKLINNSDETVPQTNKTNDKKLILKNFIHLKNISFKYQDDLPFVLKDIDFKIKKGSKVGVIGKSGSGKSTLVDLLSGLIEPTNGSLQVDNKLINQSNLNSWMNNISYVPQNIYLSDNTIAQNIAFGIPVNKINKNRLIKAAKIAEIYEFIMGLEEKFETLVGERGVKFSGGQRQRIGIARAIYRNSKILFFDEATSALDNETANSLIRNIYKFGDEYTLIIITHNISNLELCDIVIKVNNGKIENVTRPKKN